MKYRYVVGLPLAQLNGQSMLELGVGLPSQDPLAVFCPSLSTSRLLGLSLTFLSCSDYSREKLWYRTGSPHVNSLLSRRRPVAKPPEAAGLAARSLTRCAPLRVGFASDKKFGSRKQQESTRFLSSNKARTGPRCAVALLILVKWRVLTRDLLELR